MTRIDASSKEWENKVEHLSNLPNCVIKVKEIVLLEAVHWKFVHKIFEAWHSLRKGKVLYPELLETWLAGFLLGKVMTHGLD